MSVITQIAAGKQRFNAHVFASVRVKVSNIAADSAQAVVQAVEEAVSANPEEWLGKRLGRLQLPGYGEHFVTAVEFAEELTSTQVDVVGADGHGTNVLDQMSDTFFNYIKVDELDRLLRQRQDLWAHLSPYMTAQGKAKYGAQPSNYAAVGNPDERQDFRVGDTVWWMDPGCGHSSGYYQITDIHLDTGEGMEDDTIVLISQTEGSQAEVCVSELRACKPSTELPVIGQLGMVGEWQHAGYASSVDLALACGGGLMLLPFRQEHQATLHCTLLDQLPGDHPLANAYVVAPEPAVQVTLSDGTSDVWLITQNLTDRWGEINDNADEQVCQQLEASGLLDTMRALMWDEMTFIVRKNGRFGVLYELEYQSRESETGASGITPDELAALKPHSDVVAALLSRLQGLQGDYPKVSFCVPDAKEIIHSRPAVWAYVDNDDLTAQQREALGRALLAL